MTSDQAYLTSWHMVYVVVTLPIVLGNSLILISIFKFRKLQSNINILVGNLAVADLIVGAVLIPCDIAGDLSMLNWNKYYCLGKLSLFVSSLGLSCYNLMLISFERFIAIVYPLRKYTYITKRRLFMMISVGWVVACSNSVMPLIGWNNYGSNATQCVSDIVWTQGYKHYTNWVFIAANVINVILYSIVMRIALKRASPRQPTVGNTDVRANTNTDLNHLVTMIIVLGLFAVCWLPYLCVTVLVTFYETEKTQFIRRCTLIPGLFNSALNWIVFGYRNKQFRKAFWTILKCQGCCTSNTDSEMSFREYI